MKNKFFRKFTVLDAGALAVDEELSIKDAYKISRWYWGKPYFLWRLRKLWRK